MRKEGETRDGDQASQRGVGTVDTIEGISRWYDCGGGENSIPVSFDWGPYGPGPDDEKPKQILAKRGGVLETKVEIGKMEKKKQHLIYK